MVTKDLAYFEERARTEIEMARRATHEGAMKAHFEMATAYLYRIHGDSRYSRVNAIVI